ncbi:rhomboid family intramembrane serine protease [Sphingomonas sp.]|uniref:rhomboid family intramembrane serine protease n=1 Tax=Sphingomonas sp. TaxID=28214 RepID=UPI003B001C99
MRLPPARATVALVAVTSLAWAVAASAGLSAQVATLAGFVPARIADGLPVPGAVPAVLTPLGATLVHAGLLHLAFNMLILGFCGRFVEASIGPALLVLLYVAGAYAAAGAQFAIDPHSVVPMIGASGAASAIIGAYALLYGRRRTAGWGPFSGLVVHVAWLGAAWVALQGLIALAGGGMPGVPAGGSIAVAAHIGGFLAGVALARPLLLFRYRGA